MKKNVKTGEFEVIPLSQEEEVQLRTRVVLRKNKKTGSVSWQPRVLDAKPAKKPFDSHRCTFGLPRWKADDTHRSHSANFVGSPENSMRPNPLQSSTPDPTLTLYSSTDHGFPSVRKEHLERGLRKGVHLDDVKEATFLPAKSPFIPSLREDEEEVDEGYVEFHRQRRGSEDSDRARDDPVSYKTGPTMDQIARRPQFHPSKYSAATAALVEQSIQRNRAQKHTKVKRHMSFADAAGLQVSLMANLRERSPTITDGDAVAQAKSKDEGSPTLPPIIVKPSCKKKCPHCSIVEGLLDHFEEEKKSLSEKRRQDDMINRLRKSGHY